MPSDAGTGGWLLLSDQLSTNRFLDKLERTRESNELVIGHALLRRDAEQIVASYNQLVAEFNDLLRRATELAAEADRKDSLIAGVQREAEELRSGKAACEAECERLLRENMGQAIRIQWLSDIVRQDRPGYLPDC